MRAPWTHAALQIPVVSKHCSGCSGGETNAIAGRNYFQPVICARLQFGSGLRHTIRQFLFACRRECYIPGVGPGCLPLGAGMRAGTSSQCILNSYGDSHQHSESDGR